MSASTWAADVTVRGPLTDTVFAAESLRVLAVYARSLYAISPHGDVFCFCDAALPLGPFHLVCQPWALLHDSDISPGAVWSCANNVIRLPTQGAIRVSDAPVWKPVWENSCTAEGCATSLEELQRLCAVLPFPGGLGALLPEVLGCRHPACPDSPLLLLGKQGIQALDLSLSRVHSQDCFEAWGQACALLLGLGPGLTPSGDDVLGGVLLCLYSLGLRDLAQNLGQILLPMAKERTNHISLAYLHGAVAGYGSSILYEVIPALTQASPGLAQRLPVLHDMGHSSGWDTFLGAVIACKHARLLL